MIINASFWVAASFFIFIGFLIYLKIPNKINISLNNKIDEIKKELEESKKLGDILIVALNSDLSVKKIKSKDRPLVGQLDRAYVLSCLSSIDHIILFDDSSPENIICEILPEVLVKGSDYKGKKIAGEDCLIKNDKKIVLIDLIEGKSSTSIIDKASKI